MPEPRDPQTFLDQHSWGDAARVTVAGDASNRRYDRLTRADGKVAILMDAPPAKGEDVRPFMSVTDMLRAQGLSAPQILASDTQNGFLLLEDLGDALFARVVADDPSLEHKLYGAAIDVLVHLHRAPCPDLPHYDADSTTPLAALAFDWYGVGALEMSLTQAKTAFCDACHALLSPLDPALSVLIQRDYHAENLLWLPDRNGVARVGLLDYQDARVGHPAYDLVSILQDARRDVGAGIEAQMIARYVAAAGVEPAEFDTAYALMGMQRNMRILGVFARLSMAYGKPHYVDLIPRVWGHLMSNVSHPILAPVAPLITGVLPTPTEDVLQRLRDKCGSVSL